MRYLSRSILLLICLTVLFASFVGAQEKHSSDLFPIKIKGKAGFIDRTGKVIIEPQFEAVNNFSDGLAKIYVSGNKYDTAYINESGKIVIEPQFDIGSNFSEGFAWVGFDPHKTEYKVGNKTYYSGTASDSFDYNIGFIDKTGKFIIAPIFTFAEDFSEGFAVVRTKENKFGFIDKTGQFVIQPKFDWASSFSEGLAWIFINGKYGFIDKTGKTIIKPQFTKAENFSEGLACVKIGGAIRKPGFTMASITTTIADTNYAYIDRKGKIVFRINNVGEANSFSGDLARFQLFGQNEYGFIDKTGKIVIEPKIDSSGDFSDELSQVFLDEGGFGFIDKAGTIVLRTEFKNVDDFKNGLAKVCESYDFNAKCGYIDKTGKVIWQPTK